MRRWLPFMAAVALGCGSDSTTGNVDSPAPSEIPVVITVAEYEAYIASVQIAMADVNLMITEFTSIGRDLQAGFASHYWIGEFTKNMLRRLEGIRAHAKSIRPDHPELLKLHIAEYEGALEDYDAAFSLFLDALRPGSRVTTDEINDKIGAGNTHLIRLQILLGDLGGTFIDFFAAFQNDVGPGQDIGGF